MIISQTAYLRYRIFIWFALIMLLLFTIFVALSAGRYAISLSHVCQILVHQILPDGVITPNWSKTAEKVILHVRLPRILIACLTGAGLAIAGTALQSLFRNPLVGPQIIGVSSGAAFGGVLAILLFSSMWLTVSFAFLGGMLAMMLVFILGYQRYGSGILMLILAGVVINAFFAALISLITYFADPNNTLPTIVFWLMGSFSTATYQRLAVLLPAILLGGGLITACRFRLNALSLGEEQVQALGLSSNGIRWLILACVTLITSATVAISGTIGWVGLIIPHIARLVVGHDHRVLIPISALIGAIYMIGVDTIARSVTNAEIPLGIITALVGAPIFAILLKSMNKKVSMA